MWTSENEMVMECRDCGYRGNWREFDFHFGDACPECGSRAVGKSAEQSVHLTPRLQVDRRYEKRNPWNIVIF